MELTSVQKPESIQKSQPITPADSSFDASESELGATAGMPLYLQRSSVSVQPKLTIGESGDVYEQEADRVAAEVMPMSGLPAQQEPRSEDGKQAVQTKSIAISSVNGTSLQQKCSECEQEQGQRSSDGSFQAGGNLESRLSSSKGGGSPLPEGVRSFMEPRLGADFSQVRVHTGSEAVQMNRELNAQAFTHKQDVYFGAGKDPGKDALTAHELTHVVQQHGGSVEVAHRQTDEFPSPPSAVPQGESSATERLLAIVADIERVQANANRSPSDTGTQEGGETETNGHAEKIAGFLRQLRAVAGSNDEQLKLRVLAGFSSQGIQQAEAKLAEADTTVVEQRPEGLAAKPLEVSHPGDAAEIEADRVAQAVVHGANATVTQATSDRLVNRQAEALAGAGAFILATEAESLPLTSWNPPGWVILGVATVVAAALIGTAVYMASSQAETLSAAEEEAIRAKGAGQPYDQTTYNRARKKQIKNEKYEGERNKKKQRGGG